MADTYMHLGTMLSARVAALVAYALVAVVFVLDAITPESLAIEIAYQVPVIVVALNGSRLLTIQLVTLGLIGSVAAGAIEASQHAYVWDVVGLENRLLSMISLVIVGALTLIVQRSSVRLGRLAQEHTQVGRYAALSAAADRIIASVPAATVTATVVQEAPAVLESSAAFWWPFDTNNTSWFSSSGMPAPSAIDGPRSPKLNETLMRVAEKRAVVLLDAAEIFGQISGTRASSGLALAVPVADTEQVYGVLVTATDATSVDDGLMLTANTFGRLALGVMQQAKLMGELSLRNDRLNERQAIIQDLVEAISHDVRTPLSALSLTLEQSAAGAYGVLPPEYASVLRDSRASIEDIQRLAETLLLVARYESEQPRPHLELIELRQITDQLCSDFNMMATAKNIRIVSEVPAGLAVNGIRGDLRRAYGNLIANAMYHTPQGGTIEIHALRNGAFADIAIADDGYGIEPGFRSSLFERFSAAARAGAGTGLGLYIVRRVAEELGGQVRYEPRSPRGSVFTLSIPAGTQSIAA